MRKSRLRGRSTRAPKAGRNHRMLTSPMWMLSPPMRMMLKITAPNLATVEKGMRGRALRERDPVMGSCWFEKKIPTQSETRPHLSSRRVVRGWARSQPPLRKGRGVAQPSAPRQIRRPPALARSEAREPASWNFARLGASSPRRSFYKWTSAGHLSTDHLVHEGVASSRACYPSIFRPPGALAARPAG